MVGFDTRKFKEPIFSVHAHAKSCSSASFSPHFAAMVATVGTDNLCKVWDVSQPTPQMVAKRDLKQGELFSVQWY